jgi:hypothetical protein
VGSSNTIKYYGGMGHRVFEWWSKTLFMNEIHEEPSQKIEGDFVYDEEIEEQLKKTLYAY